MYEQCVAILHMIIRIWSLTGGKIVTWSDVMEVVRVCSQVAGNPF